MAHPGRDGPAARAGGDVSDRSWARDGLTGEAYVALARDLPGSALWSLLLDVFEGRAEGATAASLMRQWERDTFTLPASVDQRTLVEMDGHLLAAASAFEAIELSPPAPLGACSAISLTRASGRSSRTRADR